jgi:hypothetical protein
MDVYLKPYPGYYVFPYSLFANESSLEMVQAEITKDSTGSAVVLTTLSMSLVIV